MLRTTLTAKGVTIRRCGRVCHFLSGKESPSLQRGNVPPAPVCTPSRAASTIAPSSSPTIVRQSSDTPTQARVGNSGGIGAVPHQNSTLNEDEQGTEDGSSSGSSGARGGGRRGRGKGKRGAGGGGSNGAALRAIKRRDHWANQLCTPEWMLTVPSDLNGAGSPVGAGEPMLQAKHCETTESSKM